ncbi:MAG: type IX secretion system outer membrane channel protein PorV [Prevotellaceae bacterium]|nr:type IX secretion system outer membrane channel protein PorV [Prevotellaceae bacterium]
MKKLFGIFFLAILCATVFAQIPTVLTLAPDARSTGMGNLGVATSPDINSQHFNVAKYAFSQTQKSGVSFSYSPWLHALSDDMSVLYLSGFGKIGNGHYLSGSVSYFAAGKFILTDGTTTVTQSPAEWAVDVGYSRQLSPYFSMGLAFRYVSAIYAERGMLSVMSAGAFAADAGFYFRIPVERQFLSAGLQLANIGSKLNIGNNETAFLPMALRLGVHYEMNFQEIHALGFGVEANKPLVPEDDAGAGVFAGMVKSFGNSFSEITFGFGGEYTWNHLLAARAGYLYNHEQYGGRAHFSFGAGISYHRLLFDASYWLPASSSNNALSNTFYVTLGYFF